MKGLILAGGRGTRLRPLTFSGNKHMIPIANQPILYYGLRHLARAGIRDVAIVLGPLHEGIQAGVGDGREFGLKVEYVSQGDPRGLAHAVLCARDFLGSDPFLMYLGDNLLQSGVDPFLRLYESERPDAVVGATAVPNPQSYGVVELEDGRIVSLAEKPAVPRSNLALVGVYLFDPRIHSIIDALTPSARGELEITDAIWRLWRARERVLVLQVSGWWKDTGRPDDLLEANELVLRTMPNEGFKVQGEVEPGAVIEGRVGIGPGTNVASGAHITGPCVIGSGVRIGDDVWIGPFCSVGNGAAISRASLRRSIVLEGTQIVGISAADSLIGRNTEITSRRRSYDEITFIVGDSSRIVL